MKLLLLLRGAPGVGKTTIAKALQSRFSTAQRVVCFAADDYFYNKSGDYLFIPEKLPLAHEYCFKNTVDALYSKETEVVIVHNTFCKEEDMIQYYSLAKACNVWCASVIVEGRRYSDKVADDGEFLDRNECTILSTHDVPRDTVSKMLKELKGSILL